ncbi:unnamed protein product [Bursaphelenchus okinawaensis]|uniref:Sulfatase domain-containing protein n=1 Tax=Bursaphelenchus okinawaensis TaxID=465554 RepID=A0A811L614_9BILA|nr:unnamed protein product [Bursaphelenchus okinawaensis]CAG9117311.1 unnamed protein product [Bursaphelenchus okinawaensis]
MERQHKLLYTFLLAWLVLVLLWIDYQSDNGSVVVKNLVNKVGSKPWLKGLYRLKTTTEEGLKSTETLPQQNENVSICKLPKLDPWDPTIKDLLNPKEDPLEGCQPQYDVLTYVEDQVLYVDKEKVDGTTLCEYQCAYAVNDRDLRYGDWLKIDREGGARPDCDVFKVKCDAEEQYTFLHQHIAEQNLTKNFDPNAYSVHILMIDSTSSSQFIRTMPESMNFLKNSLESIHFPYLNKVGDNTRLNAYTFFLGERAANLTANPWGPFLAGGREDELCNKSINTENFVGFDYNKQGYVTMLNDDWSEGFFNWPNCIGFTENPADHFMNPFSHHITVGNQFRDQRLYERMYQGTCHEPADYILETLQQYVQKYHNKPKLSINVLTQLTHDSINNMYHFDAKLKKALQKAEKQLQNSFFIVMSDHGNRNDWIRRTTVGALEDRNPFFMISIPKKLRGNNNLMRQLQENSKQLITHYDLYATFFELAMENHKWTINTKFNDKPYTNPKRNLTGSSLFHPLKMPRNCNSLLIPFEFCLCQLESKSVRNDTLVEIAGNMMVERMNQALKASDYVDKCEESSLDTKFNYTLLQYDKVKDGVPYLVKISVQPSRGIYEGYVTVKNGRVTLITDKFWRIDKYAIQASCIPENFLRNYCYC